MTARRIGLDTADPQQLRRQARLLSRWLDHWDPIGVYAVDPDGYERGAEPGEYDCMVWPLLRLLRAAAEPGEVASYLRHELEQHFDVQLIHRASDVLEHGGSLTLDLPIRNTERAVGTMLGHEVTVRYGENGLPEGSIDVTLTG